MHGIEPSQQASTDTDLVYLIDRWSDLSEHVRRQIVALARGQAIPTDHPEGETL